MGGENEMRGEKRMRELGKKMKKQDERRELVQRMRDKNHRCCRFERAG
jgi:hypothetical protein